MERVCSIHSSFLRRRGSNGCFGTATSKRERPEERRCPRSRSGWHHSACPSTPNALRRTELRSTFSERLANPVASSINNLSNDDRVIGSRSTRSLPANLDRLRLLTNWAISLIANPRPLPSKLVCHVTSVSATTGTPVIGAFIAPRSPLNLKIGMPQSEQRSDEVELAAGPPTSVASSRRVDGRLNTHSVGPPPGARSPAPFCDIIWPQWKCALSGA